MLFYTLYGIAIFLPFTLIINFASALPVTPIYLDDVEQPTRMKFDVHLPTNETVQVKLVFKLLTKSKPLPSYDLNSLATLRDIRNSSTNSTNDEENSSTESEIVLPTTNKSVPAKLRTIDEAIESFRQHLIEKESKIDGVFESDHPFYRHFYLKYGDGTELPIRCTYDAKFEARYLSISCFEYRTVGADLVLSNGEYETLPEPSSMRPEYIDISQMKQLYSMTIV